MYYLGIVVIKLFALRIQPGPRSFRRETSIRSLWRDLETFKNILAASRKLLPHLLPKVLSDVN